MRIWHVIIVLIGLLILLISALTLWMSLTVIKRTIFFVVVFTGVLATVLATTFIGIHLMSWFRPMNPRWMNPRWVLRQDLMPVSGTEHRLSRTELHRLVVLLRRNLRDMWSFNVPLDMNKLKEGLTSIADDTSRVSHFELERVKWLLEQDRKFLRWFRFFLIVAIALPFFTIGFFMGISFESWQGAINQWLFSFLFDYQKLAAV